MFSKIWAHAEQRASFSAILAGVGFGLALGALFIVGGMGRQITDHTRAQRMREAVAFGYAGQTADAGTGLSLGLTHYGLQQGSDAEVVARRFGEGRGAARATRAADLECLSEAVYYEARGESPRGQAAVAQVVMNRVRHPAYPKSVCGVVFQGARARGCQFSFACDGSMRHRRESLAWVRARRTASQVLAGAVLANIGAATHFHTTAVSPAWAPQMLRVAQVGVHIFYRLSPQRARLMAARTASDPRVVLISTPLVSPPDLYVVPLAVEAAVEASLREPKPVEPDLKAPAKPAEAAALSPNQSPNQSQTPAAS